MCITVVVYGLLLFIKPITKSLGFERISSPQLLVSIGVEFLSVIWYEKIKWKKRIGIIYKP
jgi:Ca2+-transporting ATPase